MRTSRPLLVALNVFLMINLIFPLSAVPPLASVEAGKENPVSTGLFRTSITFPNSLRREQLASLGVIVLSETDQGALVLVTAAQLEALARLHFHPTSSDELGALVEAHASTKPWLADYMAPIFSQANTIQQKIEKAELTHEAAMEELSGLLATMAPESLTAIETLTSLDEDGDGLTNVEEEWWCTNPLNPNSDGDAQNYKDGQEITALLDFTLPRSVRWNYGPPFGPPSAWPDFNGQDGNPNTAACNDGDFDTIPDFAEAYMIGTRVGTGDSENTDGDKFDDGQELFGLTYCPGAPTSCGYGNYPRTQDYSFITSGMPSWVRPPGENPFIAAYPAMELLVDPNSIEIVTKQINTIERTILQGEEISTGFAETEGNSTTVGTVDTNTHNTWQENSTTEGGIGGGTAEGLLSPNTQPALILAPTIPTHLTNVEQAADTVMVADSNDSGTPSINSSPEIVVVNGVELIGIAATDVLQQTVKQTDEASSASRRFAISALQDEGDWQIVSLIGLREEASESEWKFWDDAVWFGMALLNQKDDGRWVAAIQGTAQFSLLIASVPDDILTDDAKHSLDPLQQQPEAAENDEWGYNFPWRPGTRAQYGPLGVHDNGTGSWGLQWKAVDLVSFPGVGNAPNEVRAARGGNIQVLCQPTDANDTQAIIKIDDLTYTHLIYLPELHRNGEPRMTGDYLGTLVTGTIAPGVDHCGYTDQAAGYYHLHLGFPNAGSVKFERWALNLTTGQWTYPGTSTTLGPGSWLTAGGGASTTCDNVVEITEGDSQPPDDINIGTRFFNFVERIGRKLSDWLGGGTSTGSLELNGPTGCGENSCSNQVSSRDSGAINFSDNRSAGHCGGSTLYPSAESTGYSGGGAGIAANDNGDGTFDYLRVWSQTSTTGEGYSTSHSELRSETEYSEVTRSQINTLVSSEAWATATTTDPTDAASLTFNYSFKNGGSDAAVNLTEIDINILIGNLPVITWRAPDRANILPSQTAGPFGSAPITLSLDQLAAIDSGAPIRVVLANYGYDDQLYEQNAWGKSVLFHVDDGIADGREEIDTYLLASQLQIGETYQDTLARYFDVSVFNATGSDPRDGTITNIRTPEYDANGEITGWFDHPVTENSWWEVSISAGGETEGIAHFKDMPAKVKTDVYLRYLVDSDGDGYTDRTELAAYSDANNPDIHPRPLLIAAQHTEVGGSTATVQLSLQNNGNFDASSVEVWAIAPDNTITIADNLVGGGGRVRAGAQVVLGARIGAPNLDSWTSSTAKPYMAGQYEGTATKTYIFRADTSGTVGSTAGLQISWSSNGTTWTPLNVGSGYTSLTLLNISDGIAVAFTAGTIAAGETFVVPTALPIDTFSYTINSTPYTPPLLVVSYNDPQGNHKFTSDIEIEEIQADLTPYQGSMHQGLQLDLDNLAPFAAGANTSYLVFHNPSDTTISNGKLFVELATPDGTVAKEYVLPNQTFQPGPNIITLNWNTADFSPTFDPAADYHVLVFATDQQGTIIENTVKDLDALVQDRLPQAALSTTTWNYGTVTQGQVVETTIALANTGRTTLQAYADTPGSQLAASLQFMTLAPATFRPLTLQLDTAGLPTGPYSGSLTIRTNDPHQPTATVQVSGNVAPLSQAALAYPVSEYRPWDQYLYVPGPHNLNDVVTFNHTIPADSSQIHPLYVYTEDNSTMLGVGEFGPDFTGQTAPFGVFGTGADGNVIVSSGQTLYTDDTRSALASSAATGQFNLNLSNISGFMTGQEVLIIQIRGMGAGNYEFGTISSIDGNSLSLQKSLSQTYTVDDSSRVQVVRVPHYQNLTIHSGGTLTAHAWDGSTGGIIAFRVKAALTVNGIILAKGLGFRSPTSFAGIANGSCTGSPTIQGEGTGSPGGASRDANGNGGGGGLAEGNQSYAKNASGGGGGGNGTPGERIDERGNDGTATCPAQAGGEGGGVSGNAELTNMTFGGAGGRGGTRAPSRYEGGHYGGNGGGIIYATALNIFLTGIINNDGNDWSLAPVHIHNARGGGGAGGSTFLIGQTVEIGENKVTAIGGSGGTASGHGGGGGDGGYGRIRIEYHSLTGGTNPPASTQQVNFYIIRQFSPPNTLEFYLPETISNFTRYWVQFGERRTYDGAGNQIFYVRIPKRIYSSAALDVLLENLGASTSSIALDIGNDGINDWLASATTNPVVLNSPNLASYLNTYLGSQVPGGDGSVLVPIRVNLNISGDVFLTNFAATPSADSDPQIGAADLTASDTTPVETYAITATATIHNLGSYQAENIVAAFYAGDPAVDGIYLGSDFLPTIPAGDSGQASLLWDTTGYSGTVELTVVLDAAGQLDEMNESNNEGALTVTVLTRPDLRITAVTPAGSLRDGIPTNVAVTIHNGGATAAGAQTISLYDGDPDSSGVLIGQQVASVGGHSQITANFSWIPATSGPYRFYAIADQTNVINEFDENNNLRSQEVYVGFAGPLLLDSGTANDPTYSPATGYGYVDEGIPDLTSSCGAGSLPEDSLRQDPGGRLIYRFDHLLPERFYHLDLVLHECDGAGRQEYISINGLEVAGPIDLSDGEVHRLSLLLDPAFYANHAISVTIDMLGIDGAVVAAVNLHDIDYRYADAGGSQDAAYPGSRAYGWVDGVANTTWGTLPYQSVRVDLGDNTLRYQFDNLDPSKRYNIHLTLWQPSGTARIEKVQIDGVDIGLTINTGDYQKHNETVAVPLAAYQTDGSIIVSLVRQNASTGAMVNEIALEEETLIAAGIVQGVVTLQGRTNHSGPLITAWDGSTAVLTTTASSSGGYGLTLTADTYNISVEMSRYLDAQRNGVVIGIGETVSLPSVTLLGGDANDDDTINILDLSLIGSRFGLACGSPSWDSRADINNDCLINILDLTLAGGNFGKSSPVPWP